MKEEERVKFNDVKDAARAWLVAVVHYSNLGGWPCEFTRSIGATCRAAGISSEEMEEEYLRAKDKPITPYWMGWVARIFYIDWSSGFSDPKVAVRRLGCGYSKTEEYQMGWEDSQRAAAILLSLAPEAEYEGPSIDEINEALERAGYKV